MLHSSPLTIVIAALLLLFCGGVEVPQEFFFGLTAKDIDGKEFPFEKLQGSSLVVITNVDSEADEMSDDAEAAYKEFTQLGKAERLKGLHILAFPCDQFGKEAGSASELKDFAANYDLKANQPESRFHLMGKIDVNGKSTHPVYRFLKKHAGQEKIEKNFATKFVIYCKTPRCSVSRYDGVSVLEALKKAQQASKATPDSGQKNAESSQASAEDLAGLGEVMGQLFKGMAGMASSGGMGGSEGMGNMGGMAGVANLFQGTGVKSQHQEL